MAKFNKDAQNRPIQKIYKRIGLRRDQNFADLTSPTNALENLLDKLIDDTGNTFLASDLNAIANTFAEGLTNSDYLKIAQSAVETTTSDGTTLPFDPRITYQNRLDKIQIFSGVPRLNGGDGLTANYYQNDQILFDEPENFEYNVNPNFPVGIATAVPSGDVFKGETTEGIIPSDTFWEEGHISYTAKIHPQSSKVNTGVKWEGYFIPTISGKVNFDISCTGYFTMDFQQEGYSEDNDNNETNTSKNRPVGAGNTFTEHMRVGVSTSISGISGSANTIVVDSSNLEKMNTIGIGMTVVLDGKIATGTKIEGFNKVTGEINLEPPSGVTNSVTGTISNENVQFTRHLGDNIRHIFDTHVLIAYQRYRIRLRYFHHKNFEAKDIVRSLDVNFRQANMNAPVDLRFNQLFTLGYNFTESAKGEFNRYFDNSVRFGGTNLVGLGNTTNSSSYVKVLSSNKLDITYTPKQELGDGSNLSTGIVRSIGNYNIVNGSPIIFVSNTLTTGIEIGNYIIGENIPEDTRVADLSPNSFIEMDKPATGTATQSLKFINHRGFVRKVRVTNNSGSDTLTAISGDSFKSGSPDHKTTNTDVQVNMIGISTNISGYKRVKSMTSFGSLTLSDSVSTVANEEVFFYQSRGLKDNSLMAFCDRFDPEISSDIRCGISSFADPTSIFGVGTLTFGVENLKGVGANWELQGAYFGADGIKIDSVDGTTNPQTITLKSGITRPLPHGAQFTMVAPVNVLQAGDYQLCCPPTDTSPPFEPSDEGLNTTTDYRNFKLIEGNLVFDALTIRDFGNNTSDLSDSDPLTVNKKISIKTPVGNYKILGQKIN